VSRSPKYARARLRSDLAASLGAARDRRQERRRRAVAGVAGAGVGQALAAGGARWSALEADARAAGIALGVYAIVPDVLAEARDRLDRGDAGGAAAMLDLLAARLDDAEREVDAAIDRVEERRVLMAAVVRALPRVGLAVDGDHTTSADGTLGVRARRVRGDGIGVAVTAADGGESRLLYHLDAVAAADRRSPAASRQACGVAVRLLDRLHGELRPLGVDAGPVDWDGRDAPGRTGTRAPSRSRGVPSPDRAAGTGWDRT
jgi:hypothetical protein